MKSAEVARPASLDAAVAGFIVWLAHHHIPSDQRQRCPDIVERFVRWQHGQREHDACYTEDIYCAHLMLRGASESRVDEVRAAIGLFRRYLRTAA